MSAIRRYVGGVLINVGACARRGMKTDQAPSRRPSNQIRHPLGLVEYVQDVQETCLVSKRVYKLQLFGNPLPVLCGAGTEKQDAGQENFVIKMIFIVRSGFGC